VAILLVVTAFLGGASALCVVVGILGAITALYGMISGRRTWASIPSRKAAALVLVASVVAFSGGAAGLPDVGTPPAAFTDEAPADPSAVVSPPEDPTVVVPDATTDTTAAALLATLPVKGKAPKTGYDREGEFGSAWIDVDRNGCDTRNDILTRDLTDTVTLPNCKVASGTLVSPFTGATINFVRGEDTSALVQIDHVVALSNAWQTGAQQLTQGQRIALANDPINLLAVDGRSNSQKGDGDTATWLPSNRDVRCSYVARQISVKATYGLWVVPAERDAMSRILENCADEPAVTSTFPPASATADTAPVATPEPAPVVTPEPEPVVTPNPIPEEAAPPVPAPVPAPAAVVYANCDAVRAAGAAPIYAGTPGYSTKLDRDKDGIGCDS
jgi:hypothetical protein